MVKHAQLDPDTSPTLGVLIWEDRADESPYCFGARTMNRQRFTTAAAAAFIIAIVIPTTAFAQSWGSHIGGQSVDDSDVVSPHGTVDPVAEPHNLKGCHQDGDCNDGDLCTVGDYCNVNGVCVSGGVPDAFVDQQECFLTPEQGGEFCNAVKGLCAPVGCKANASVKTEPQAPGTVCSEKSNACIVKEKCQELANGKMGCGPDDSWEPLVANSPYIPCSNPSKDSGALGSNDCSATTCSMDPNKAGHCQLGHAANLSPCEVASPNPCAEWYGCIDKTPDGPAYGCIPWGFKETGASCDDGDPTTFGICVGDDSGPWYQNMVDDDPTICVSLPIPEGALCGPGDTPCGVWRIDGGKCLVDENTLNPGTACGDADAVCTANVCTNAGTCDLSQLDCYDGLYDTCSEPVCSVVTGGTCARAWLPGMNETFACEGENELGMFSGRCDGQTMMCRPWRQQDDPRFYLDGERELVTPQP